MNKLKVENIVFCESVRSEVGGKHTLLGAFAPELNIAEVPANILMAIWVSGTPSGIGQFDAEFRALGVDGTTLLNAQINGDFAALGKTSMIIGSFPLAVKEAGEYSFEWNFGNSKWDKIGKLLIHHTPASILSSPTAPPQPS